MAVCACGCGESLPQGSKRNYVYGHRKKANKQLAQDFLADIRKEPKQVAEPPAAEAFEGLGTTWDDIQDQNPFDSLIASLPDDPEPDQKARDIASQIIQPDGTPIVTKQVAKDIQGKLAFLLSMPASMLQTIDPYCFGTLLERTPDISAKLTPIICQSPDMVKFFTKGSGFILWLNLAVSVWPVVQVIIAHHVLKNIGHEEKINPETGEKVKVKVAPDYSQYHA